MYIEVVPNRKSKPTILLREGRREGKRVIKTTLANLSKWPEHVVEGLRSLLKGGITLDHADQRIEVTRSLPHGHVAAVLGSIHQCGLDKVIGVRKSDQRNIAIGLIASRILNPSSKLATSREWSTATASSSLSEELDITQANEQDIYATMDWLLRHQAAIEKKLAAKHLEDGSLILCDVSASYYTGSHCSLAKFGHKKDGKLGVTEIVYGLICDHQGCPVAIEVFEGNTADPTVFTAQIKGVRERFGIEKLIVVGDRGLITQARIDADLSLVDGLDWITALRSDAIRSLMNQGTIQLSLFDRKDMAEVHSPDFPGERLIVCRNPLLAEKRSRKRNELLDETERLLQVIVDATKREKRVFKGKDKIALRAGRVVNKYKMSKHFSLTIEEESFSFERNEEAIRKEAALDGFYVIRTSVKESRMDARKTVQTYKDLSRVEQAFRSIKTVDLHIRPIYHRLEDRVRAHVFVCMLAYYVEWHMRQKLAPVLFDDEDKEAMAANRDSIVAPAQRSPSGNRKASSRKTTGGMPVHSFQTLLGDLATISRNTIHFKIKGANTFDRVTSPTSQQQKAIDLLGVKLKCSQ